MVFQLNVPLVPLWFEILVSSYYKTRNVYVFVCPLSPLAFADRFAPNLAGRSGMGTLAVTSRKPSIVVFSHCTLLGNLKMPWMAGNAIFLSVCADESQLGIWIKRHLIWELFVCETWQFHENESPFMNTSSLPMGFPHWPSPTKSDNVVSVCDLVKIRRKPMEEIPNKQTDRKLKLQYDFFGITS